MYGTGARTIHGTGESLDDIVRRASLPITVRYNRALDYWLVSPTFPDGTMQVWRAMTYAAPHAAARAYFALVSQLQSTASPVDDALPPTDNGASAARPLIPGLAAPSLGAP